MVHRLGELIIRVAPSPKRDIQHRCATTLLFSMLPSVDRFQELLDNVLKFWVIALFLGSQCIASRLNWESFAFIAF
jgi:hypothetical protein